MDFKEIKNTKHYLYDDSKELHVHQPDVPVRHNWRHGEEGEWVFTDDGYVCQVLKKQKIINKRNDSRLFCIRTVCGTFDPTNMKREMLGEDGIAENIYSFSGTTTSKSNFNNKKRNSREVLFGHYVASGINSIIAYKLVYPDAKNEGYIADRVNKLLKTEKIKNMVSEEKLALLASKGATREHIIERLKTIADLAEKDSDKLRALESLAKFSGLYENEEKKSEKLEIWAGFSPEQLEGVTEHGKPKLIAHAEREQKEET